MCDWRILKENENYEININNFEIRNSRNKRVIKPWINKGGYYTVTLSNNGDVKKYLLHRLIYNNFLGKLEPEDIIDHIDNDRLNNSLENLRIVTASENSINSKRTTDFVEIDEKSQQSLIVLDLENEVFFYKELSVFIRKIYQNKFRILPIQYLSQFYQRIQYRTNGKNYQINITRYLYPELAENLNFTLIHTDGIYFDEVAKKFYRYHEKSGIFKELKQFYHSKKCIEIQYYFDGKKKNMNVFGYLHKNDFIEVQ